MKDNNHSHALHVALEGGAHTKKVIENSLRLTASLRRLGLAAPESENKLDPPLGTTWTRVSRLRSL